MVASAMLLPSQLASACGLRGQRKSQRGAAAVSASRLQLDAPPAKQQEHRGRIAITASVLPDFVNKERYQPQLSNNERSKLRKQSQQLGKEITIVTIGRAGITKNTLISLGDALAGNELVKVKVGANCELDMDQVRDALTVGADCVQVHNIGFTVTLYRDKSLPRPLSSLPDGEAGQAQWLNQMSAQEKKQHKRRERLRQVRTAERDVMAARPSAFEGRHAPRSSASEVVSGSAREKKEPTWDWDAVSNDERRANRDWHSASPDRSAASRDGDAPSTGPGSAARLGLCALAATLALSQGAAPASAAVAHQLVLADNAAVLSGLERYERGAITGDDAPATTAQRKIGKLQQIQQQLQRIGTLVGIGQYDSARIQLREGSLSRMRKTLKEAEEDFTTVQEEDVKAAIKGIEALDSALRAQNPEESKRLAYEISEELGVLEAAVSAAD